MIVINFFKTTINSLPDDQNGRKRETDMPAIKLWIRARGSGLNYFFALFFDLAVFCFARGVEADARNLASNSSILFSSAACSVRAFAAMALTASNSSRCTIFMSDINLSMRYRTMFSTSSLNPIMVPAALLATLARSSKIRLRVCMLCLQYQIPI